MINCPECNKKNVNSAKKCYLCGVALYDDDGNLIKSKPKNYDNETAIIDNTNDMPVSSAKQSNLSKFFISIIVLFVGFFLGLDLGDFYIQNFSSSTPILLRTNKIFLCLAIIIFAAAPNYLEYKVFWEKAFKQKKCGFSPFTCGILGGILINFIVSGFVKF